MNVALSIVMPHHQGAPTPRGSSSFAATRTATRPVLTISLGLQRNALAVYSPMLAKW